MSSWRLIAGILTMFVAWTAATKTYAQSIEILIMPGPVAEAHAEYESECSSCHKAFEKSAQKSLCRDCHEDVDADLKQSRGFHGLSDEVAAGNCADCHTDHEGRDADIVDLDESSFNHELTDFNLLGAHIEVVCGDCHAPDEKHRDTSSGCFDCHQDDDVHKESLGTDCAECHYETEWTDVTFDHDATSYPLVGKHQDIACLDCHSDPTFQGAPTTCFGCHEKDDVHEGRSGPSCENCHNPRSWTDTSFNHARDTNFPLEGSHGELSCADCHSDEPFSDELDQACVSCHFEDDEHDQHFGPDCGLCHTDVTWDAIDFDHGRDTDYPLRGAHEPIECVACHVEPIFETPLASDCSACHSDDDPHDGEQGTQCETCHNEIAWDKDVFFDHGLTLFPLLGKHVEVACDDCHESHVFRDADTECESCHREEDPHNDRYVEACALCHSPVDWAVWRFDHNIRTDFPIEGAHANITCDTCHRQSLSVTKKLGSRCGECHRSDDVHDGEFGFDCKRCHSVDSFSEVRSFR